MILKGFRFGMILQLALGPISLFILQVGLEWGTALSLQGVMGVTLVDGLYVLGAILGMGALIEKSPKGKLYLKYIGGTILILFGLSYILPIFSYQVMAESSLEPVSNQSIFIQAVIMTGGNPLTMVFWAGVFSTKMSEENMTRKSMYLFGCGAILSTLLCMTLIALLGGYLSLLVSRSLLVAMNVIVGLLLIVFGIKTIWRRKLPIADS